jgi:antitoxin component of RelBE/YafQ-DinJ toxin-antitoxin module
MSPSSKEEFNLPDLNSPLSGSINLLSTQSDVCESELGKYMKLPFFKDQPTEKQCAVVKTVRESAREVAEEIGISPATTVDETALTFVGEKGLPPETTEGQDEYFKNLWERVSPLINDKSKGATIEEFQKTVLTKLQEEAKPLNPPSKPVPNNTTNNDRPEKAPEASSVQKTPEPVAVTPTKPPSPQNLDLSKPSDSLQSHPRAASSVPSTAEGAPLKPIPNQLSSFIRPSLADNVSGSMAPKRSSESSFTQNKEMTQEPSVVGTIAPAVPTNRLPMSSFTLPEVLKAPTTKEGSDRGLPRGTNSLDLALNALSPNIDSNRTERLLKNSPKPDAASEQKIMKEETGQLSPIQKQPELKGPFKTQNILSNTPDLDSLNKNIGILPIPIPQALESTFSNAPTPYITPLNKRPSSSAQAPNSLNSPKTNLGYTPTLSYKSGNNVYLVSSAPLSGATPPGANNLPEKGRNIFSGLLDFAKNHKNQIESPLRTITSDYSLQGIEQTERDTASQLTIRPQSSPLSGSSYLPWLTFLLGSVGTLCFLFAFAFHVRNRRSKSMALVVSVNRSRNLN